MTKKIYFDMDGTVADLYGTEGWLEGLRTERAGLFRNLKPLVDMNALAIICNKLIAQGYEIGIITWLPIDATIEYQTIATKEKIEWANEFMPYVKEIYAQVYGTPKQKAPTKKARVQILVDDNEEVRQMWETPIQRKTINAKENILKELENLLDR